MISAIEIGSVEKIYFWVKIFLLAFILKVIARVTLATIFHLVHRIVQIGLFKKYLHNYIELDNTRVETF
ncbi:MAG: hypothetical protein LBC61_02705 [Candidatus Peribacteria bacterium]|jgi:hypothetical protein|nr:hypothetical protein [Candidatus Peribacteria bacterium]